MKVRALSIYALVPVLALISPACRRAPSPDRPVEVSAASLKGSIEGRDLILKKGLKIKLAPLAGTEPPMVLTVDNPSGAEGLSFEWSLATANPESRPSAADDSGKMTLANTVDGRRMTLPAFWPGGELFLSNSSAVWLSDRAFSELKKNGKTPWDLGLADNAMVGPLQGNDLVEASLELTGRGLEANPEKKAQALELTVSDKSVDYRLKVNGQATEVEAIEAENALARLKVLDNAQNPLILEVEVAPQASAGAKIFFPLSWVRDKLSYRVEEISLQ